ncbi:hypothetical protein [Spirosoma agri]|uniref:Uncharacterized protein n=1 Tax=Spirosoma agri TaxID=1987381 RepID=A0A6M0IJW8_9BACT|nr:hypothetical protein [Spirosoma agri]NEU68157.1 hypothetical protein [Spirosoma agri]
MIISRQDYNKKPLAIQQGALLLWGKLLMNYREGDFLCQLYSLNNFFVQSYSSLNPQKIVKIYTFHTTKNLKINPTSVWKAGSAV